VALRSLNNSLQTPMHSRGAAAFASAAQQCTRLLALPCIGNDSKAAGSHIDSKSRYLYHLSQDAIEKDLVFT